jgi:uncharacterized CHY-type Zn-finger protein
MSGIKCVRCGDKVFSNELVKAGSSNFHDACFKCMVCNKRMTLGKTTETKDGKVVCPVCYGSKYGPKVYGFTSSGEGGSGLDVSKQSEVVEDFKTVTPSTTKTVQKTNSSSNLGSQKFSNNSNCVNCQKKVFENERVSAHGYVFHDTCFQCMNCKKRMTLGKTNDTPDHRVLCQVCYNSLHGPKVYGFSNSGESGTGLDVSKQSVESEKKSTSSTSSKSGNESDLAALEKLAALRDKGILTDEEFQTKKRQILGL